MQENVVEQIRQYHGVVTNAHKTIADAGREQIRAAYRCGQLLVEQKRECPSNGWGRWCKTNLPEMSKSTIGRYILLTEVSDLTLLERKYRTLNAAYEGEGITSPKRQGITVIRPGQPDSGVKPTIPHQSKRESTNGGGTNHDSTMDLAPSNGDGHNDIDLKAKVKGGGTLGDLKGKLSPSAWAQIESQLHPATNGDQVQKAKTSRVAPVEDSPRETTSAHRLIDPLEVDEEDIAGLFQGPVLIDALLLQLKQCAETEDPLEIDACVSYLKPIVRWYEEYAAKTEALAE